MRDAFKRSPAPHKTSGLWRVSIERIEQNLIFHYLIMSNARQGSLKQQEMSNKKLAAYENSIK